MRRYIVLVLEKMKDKSQQSIACLALISIAAMLTACDGSSGRITDSSPDLVQILPNTLLAESLVGIWDAGSIEVLSSAGATVTDEKYYVIESSGNGALFLSQYDYMGDNFNGSSLDFPNCYTAGQKFPVSVHDNELFSFGTRWLKLLDDTTLGYATSADDALQSRFANVLSRSGPREFNPVCEGLPSTPPEEPESTMDEGNDNDSGNTLDLIPAEELQNLVPVPAAGAYIGMNTGDSANAISVSSREFLLGHEMAIERIFYGKQHWTLDRINIDQITNTYIQGRIPMVSYKVGAWKDVTSGKSDAIIDKLAGQIKESGIPILLTFHHEAEDDACFNATPDCGEGQTAQDFVDMWRYMHNRFTVLEVKNVSWNWVAMGWQWGPGGNDNVRNHIESMFPGSEYVDWMSADLYNMAGNCSLTAQQINNRWLQLQERGQGWYDWASQFNKPLALAEWGTFDDVLVEGRKAEWFRNASATLQSWTNIKAVVYFDRLHDGCDWRIDTGGEAELEGYRELIGAPWFIKG